MSQKRIEKPAMLLAGYTVKASAETTEPVSYTHLTLPTILRV